MSDSPQPISIPIAKLQIDPGYQPREALSRDHIEHLRHSDYRQWPPLLVAALDNGYYVVLDGAHRLEASKSLEVDGKLVSVNKLPCIVVNVLDYGAACEANLKHGLPLSTRDRKEYAVWLHESNPALSYREIGRRCQISNHTVKTALKNPDGQPAHFPPSRETVARSLLRFIDKLSGTKSLAGIIFTDAGYKELAQALTQVSAEDKDMANSLKVLKAVAKLL